MILNMYQKIASGLKQIKDCTVYMEDVPQNFKRPSFMITFYDQNPKRGINGKLKNKVRVDILYFPKSEQDVNCECLEVGQNLTREFAADGFRIQNRNLKITDSVLHFLFDINYQEYLEIEEIKMQALSQNTDMKEE